MKVTYSVGKLSPGVTGRKQLHDDTWQQQLVPCGAFPWVGEACHYMPPYLCVQMSSREITFLPVLPLSIYLYSPSYLYSPYLPTCTSLPTYLYSP